MSAKRKTARVVLRLDAASAPAPVPALRAIARLARAMEAEFAARLIEDRRVVDALAFGTRAGATAMLPGMHHIERSLRRQVEVIATEANALWSFDIAQCGGVFAAECALHDDDLLAIALPEIEQMMGILRDEISNALSRTSGVLLVPRTQPHNDRPIVGVIADAAALAQVVEAAVELAQRLSEPLAFVIADGEDLLPRVRAATAALWHGPGAVALHAVPSRQLDIVTAHVRALRPKLVVLAPDQPSIQEFLARPRLLREMSAPLLVLRLMTEPVA